MRIRRSGEPTGIGTCIAGLGGFAAAHHSSVRTLESEGRLRLLATCDPRHGELAQLAENFRLAERGVEIFAEFDEMLAVHAVETRLVTVATPIRAHAGMHAACVNQGLACYLEKPPTLDPFELEEMIVRDAAAAFQTQVGFSYIIEPWRHALKDRLWSGEFGRIISAGALGFWQRPSAYYTRSAWAGRLAMEGGLVLDSCFGNAMAHHIHNLLFFAGEPGLFSWAEIDRVRAELYRTNAIESADTVISEAVTKNGVILRAALTHACPSARTTAERITTEKAEIFITPGESAEIRHLSGRIERLACSPTPITDYFRSYADYLEGRIRRPVTTLADSRSMVVWNALLYVAARRIHTIPAGQFSVAVHSATQTPVHVIHGVEPVLDQFLTQGKFPSESGIPWAAPGGTARRSDLSLLHDTISSLADPEQADRFNPDGDLVPA